MDNFNFKKYLKEGKLSKKENLNEFTNYGGEGLYPMSEKPGDMFQQKEVEELFPIAFSSKDDKDFKDKLAQHADWTEQSGMNNTFVHVQYHETKNLPDDYFIYQSQHYNTNYDDFRNPRFTILSITKNKDTDKEEDLGEYIVSTPEYIKDIRALDVRDKLGRAVSENKIKTPQTKAIASAVQKHFTPQKNENLDVQATSIDFVYENRAQDLASDYSLGELNDMLKQLYGEMEQEAEPEGGPIADQYADEIYQYEEAIRIKKGVGQRGRKDIPYDVAIGRMTQDEYDKMMSTVKPDRDSFEKSSKFDRIKEEEYTLDFGELDEVLKEQGKSDIEIKEIKSKLLKLSESNKVKAQELTEKLCKKGEAYRKRRMAAGEKSSAYLSGRAVKVCKGQISGRKKKK